MATVKVTNKGQVTIPKSVRDSLHLHSADRVEFVVLDDSEAVLRPINKSVDEIYGKLYDPDQPTRTMEEINEGMASRFSSHEQ